jgi:monoamine oxidase
VRFVPELPDKFAAATRLEMGAAIKGTFKFRERFWAELPTQDGRAAGTLDRLGFLRAPGQPFPTWWTTYPLLAPLLACWVAGPAAERMAELDDADLLDRALDSLAVAFAMPRAEAEVLMQEWHLHNWQRDPFSRGAYSYVGIGGLDGQRALAEPMADTLFFAGEATECSGHHGTINGAIATGLRAAREILALGIGA